ncbi:glycosyltransferase [Oculatella sp. LEGE 06141]|uniref:glycosyltransferase family 2 protein n=1 Tax=Oculatella sp. LEGE 06141 TaxID=1828648 RepID=UPI00188215BB|nr:glycosyltransferase [Oculatella sp. LEGE 06141]MBE9178309.1 glycosyltransferase [Oculatella sp. LEGE 06141]
MEQPFFSIVIPTYARPERLAKCLQSLTCLTYPRDRFEVIVVDDGSEPPIESVAAPFRDRLALSLIRQANAGPAAARNTGAAHASGQFLAFTDDDCAPAPDWLEQLRGHFAIAPTALIGGHTLNALPHNLYSTTSQTLTDYLYQFYTRRLNQPNFFASNNFALPAELFQAIGGFDTTFPLAAGEDREFCDRWLEKGYPMIYAPAVQVHHAHELALPTFWRQHFNYGRGAFYFHQVRRQRTAETVKIEPFSFYTRLLTYPFSQRSPQPSVLVAALLFLSQVANVSGFVWEKNTAQAGKPAQR